jgi:hypothetical protein
LFETCSVGRGSRVVYATRDDTGYTRLLWKAGVGDWERQVTADAWRVRRLVARWIEEGALQPV